MGEVAWEGVLRRGPGETTRFIFGYFPFLGLAWPVSVVLKCYHILNYFQWPELLQSRMKHDDPYDCHAWTSRILAFPILQQLCFNGHHSAQYRSQLWQRISRVREKSHQESTKYERYCREQRDFLRALVDFAANERMMYELDTGKIRL